MEHIANKLSND